MSRIPQLNKKKLPASLFQTNLTKDSINKLTSTNFKTPNFSTACIVNLTFEVATKDTYPSQLDKKEPR
jgi:hypothetical protein